MSEEQNVDMVFSRFPPQAVHTVKCIPTPQLIVGRVDNGPVPFLVSPVSNKKCAFYKIIAQELRDDKWITVFTEIRTIPFFLERSNLHSSRP